MNTTVGARSLLAGLRRPDTMTFDAIGTVGLNVVTMGVNFALTFLLSRLLGAEGYGAFAFGLAWATVLSVPAVLGLTPLVIRHAAAYQARSAWGLLRGLLRRSNEVVAGVSLLVMGAGGAAGWLIDGSQPQLFHPFLLALLLIPLLSLTSVRQAAMQGLGRVVLGRVPETLLAPLLFFALAGASSVVLGHRFSAVWAMGLQVAAQITAFAMGVVLLRRALPVPVREAAVAYETRAWLRSAVPLLIMSGLMALNAQLGTIFLGSLKGAAAAGVYGVTSRAALVTSFFWLAATYPLMPAVARLHAQEKRAELQRLLSRSAIAASLCSLPIALGLVLFAHRLLVLFGHDFAGGVWPLRILVFGELGKVLTGFAGLALVMTGYERDLTVGVAIAAALNVALNATLVPRWGVDGAALAGSISVVASNLFLVFVVWRRLGALSLPVARRSRA